MPSLNPQLQGRDYWRSLQQLSDSPELTEAFAQEFHGYNPEGITQASRRDFMKIMGAAMALAGLTLTGCRRWPEQEIRPHANQPEGIKPGVPLHYASIIPLAGVATGLLVKSYDGRPIKIEGNAQHPYSLGAADCFAQASVLDVYDPDRSRFPFEQAQGHKRQRSWDDFVDLARTRFSAAAAGDGQRLAVLTQASSSPTLQRLRQLFLQRFPQANWNVYEPIHQDHEIAGTKLAYGQPLRPIFHLDKAQTIVSFDADLLGLHPAHQKYARDWASGRRSADQGRMNRLFVVESDLSITGSVADHRLPARPSAIPAVLLALAAKLGLPGSGEPATLAAPERQFVDALAADLQNHKGRSLLAAGPSLSPECQALVHALNDLLGNTGKTVTFIAPPPGSAVDSLASIASLTDAMRQGKIDTLLILGGNPVYNAPADLAFAQALAKVDLTIHLSPEVNETSLAVRWHLPMAHFLESWGDGLAWDGTLSVQQPLILPLFDGKSDIEVLALILGLAPTAGLDLVRQTLKPTLGVNFENNWRKLLHDGLLPDSAAKPVAVTPSPTRAAPALPPAAKSEDLEIRFLPSAATFDGRFANNGWLQETPDPLTKITWDNPALISKADADRLQIKNGDLLKVSVPGASSGGSSAAAEALTLEIAAWIQPGLAQGTLALPLGYGRKAAGNVGTAVGFDTYALRTSANSYLAPRVTVVKTGRSYKLAATQEHHLIDGVGIWGREKRTGQKGESGMLIREATLDQYRRDNKVFHRNAHGDLSLQLFEPPTSREDQANAWGMAIDMNSCIGCNACTVACQAENNIPIVGKEQVATHREMHWLRIDRYFKHDPKTDPDVQNPDVVYAPVACVHCENAPCEQVCPVAATVHDSEGLNTMVYNRCIGTRYCSNNCPYKVRRFNYFDYHSKDPRGMALPWLNFPDSQQTSSIDQIKQMIYNPQVTVRMRGVMEKCTYCVQRIQEAKITAKVQHAQGRGESDQVQDGQVVTACQAACPTEAIVFGNLNDPRSKVAMVHKNNRAYAMLEELNIRPRTRHLAKVRNPVS